MASRTITNLKVESVKAEVEQSQLEYYSREINSLLVDDEDLASSLPIEDPAQLVIIGTKGVLLCKLINRVKNGTIEPKKFKTKPRNVYEIIENQNEAIRGAIAFGCKVVNITAMTLMDEKKPIALLAIIWQILRYYLVSTISLKEHPEMMRLLQSGEDLNSFVGLTPEQRLLRWVNHHLLNSGYTSLPVKNFNSDWLDGDAFVYLLHQLNPQLINKDDAVNCKGAKKFDHVISAAEKLGIKTFKSKDLALGDEVLNIAFVASLFHANPSLADAGAAEEEKQREANALKEAQELLAERERQAETSRQKIEEEWNLEVERKAKEIEEQAQEWKSKHAQLESKATELQLRELELHERSRKMEEELQKQKEEMERLLRQQKEHLEQELLKAKEIAAVTELARSAAMEAAAKNAALEAARNAAARNAAAIAELNLNVDNNPRAIKVLKDLPDKPVRKLYITVAEGRDLIQCDIGSQSDPYVVVEHLKPGAKKPVSKFRTKVIMDNQVNPAWYETMEFRNFDMKDTIRVRVWDYDLTGKDFMGEFEFTRADIVNGKLKAFNLGPRAKKPKQKVHGTISLEFECFYDDVDWTK